MGMLGEHSEMGRAATVLLMALALIALLTVTALLRSTQNQRSGTGTKAAPVKFFCVGWVVRFLAFSQLF
jgi:Tfp pilus assembly protein PilX